MPLNAPDNTSIRVDGERHASNYWVSDCPMTSFGRNGRVYRGGSVESTARQADATQLSLLSSVLNGLEGGACAMRRRAQQAIRAVRAGTYRVDAAKLSRLIIGEAMMLV
jgi:hypothetical protein